MRLTLPILTLEKEMEKLWIEKKEKSTNKTENQAREEIYQYQEALQVLRKHHPTNEMLQNRKSQ